MMRDWQVSQIEMVLPKLIHLTFPFNTQDLIIKLFPPLAATHFLVN